MDDIIDTGDDSGFQRPMKRLLICLAILLTLAVPASAQITHGSVNTTVESNGTPASITTGSLSPGANHFLGVFVYTSGSTARLVNSVTDASSLCAVAWKTSAAHASLKFSDASVGEVEIVYCYKTNANTGTLTFNMDTNVNNGIEITLREYVGVDTTADPYDSAPGGASNTGLPGPSITLANPTVSGSLALLGSGILNATGGFSWSNATVDLSRDDATATMGLSSADILNYASSTTVGVTSTHTGTQVAMVGAVFKAASGGGGGTAPKSLPLLGVGGDEDQRENQYASAMQASAPSKMSASRSFIGSFLKTGAVVLAELSHEGAETVDVHAADVRAARVHRLPLLSQRPRQVIAEVIERGARVHGFAARVLKESPHRFARNARTVAPSPVCAQVCGHTIFLWGTEVR